MAISTAWELYDVDKLKAAIMYAYTGAGQGHTSWAKVNTMVQGMTDAQVYEMCSNLNSSGVITNSYNALYPTPVNGTLGTAIRVSETYAADNAATLAANAMNSNSATAAARTMELNIPANAVKTGQQIAFQEGATVVKTATKAEVALGHLATGVIGAGIGLQLGVWLDGLLYNLNPDFWDSHNLSEVNPQTWGTCTIGKGLLDWSSYPQAPVMVDKDGQFYCDEQMFAMVAQYLAKSGFFGAAYPDVTKGDLPDSDFYFPEDLPASVILCPQAFSWQKDGYTWYIALTGASGVSAAITGNGRLLVSSESQFNYNLTLNGEPYSSGQGNYVESPGGTGYYMLEYALGIDLQTVTAPYNPGLLDYNVYDVTFLLTFGHRSEPSPEEGVHQFDTIPEGITPEMTIADVLDLLEDQYPDLFDKRLKNSVIQPDGTIVDKYYLPISVPEGGTETQPTSKPENQGEVDPENEDQSKRAIESQTPVDETDPENNDTGSGTTPALVTPTGAAEALYAIYNPTLQEVKDLGAWLWSPNFIDQLLKMFSSPMEAIISLHKIYGTPHTSGSQHIKVGYLDSGVSAAVVDQQYIDIDCGSVSVKEFYAGVFDYSPFSEIHLYLPFIGIVPLDIADVMRGSVKVIYHIDVITGAVLAEVKITRDGSGGVIYQYTGSCAEHFPLSAGSYVGVVTGMAGITAGIAGSIATGGALAPALIGAGAGIGAMHTSINKSGNFTANAGAMGIKKPYLIISRPQSAMADNFQHMSGLGANTYCTLASCSGYVRVKNVHLNNVTGASREDLQDIEAILKKGVIV